MNLFQMSITAPDCNMFSVQAEFISAWLHRALSCWLDETSLKWIGGRKVVFTSQQSAWSVIYQEIGWDESAWITACLTQPSLTMIHGIQAVMCTVASSVFPLQPTNWAAQSPSQDLYIYTLGLNFSGIQEVQQYSRVGRNGMSPIREMCTASKLFFFPILEILEDLCWTASKLRRKKKKDKYF